MTIIKISIYHDDVIKIWIYRKNIMKISIYRNDITKIAILRTMSIRPGRIDRYIEFFKDISTKGMYFQKYRYMKLPIYHNISVI